MNTPTYRDDELGAALRALETPEHRPGFAADLRQRLADGHARPGRLRAFRGLAPRRSARRAFVAVALAAVAALTIALPVADRVGGSDVATAAQVQAKVSASLGSLESLSGVVVSACSNAGCPGEPIVRTWSFVLTSDGDLRLGGPTGPEVVTYDASEGLLRTAQRSASIGGGPLFFAERRNVAPGPPDLGPPTWILPQEFGSFVRALLAAEDPRVREIVYDGRPAWKLVVEAVPNAIVPDFTGDRFEITVDRETGIPVRVVERKGAATLRELRVERLAVDEDAPPGAFRLEFPQDAEVSRGDDGFRRVGLDEVPALAGYAPLVPGRVPEGYQLAEVAVAEQGGPTGVEAGNPQARKVVSLSYRRGFDQLVVTTRLAGDGVWGDPVATGEGYLDNPEAITIRRGALRGTPAELVLEPRGIPHVWAATDDLVVTVAGGLGRDELVRVTESLEARR